MYEKLSKKIIASFNCLFQLGFFFLRMYVFDNFFSAKAFILVYLSIDIFYSTEYSIDTKLQLTEIEYICVITRKGKKQLLWYIINTLIGIFFENVL